MSVRSYVDDTIRVEQLRLQAEALGLTEDQIDHLELAGQRMSDTFGYQVHTGVEEVLRIVQIEVAFDRLRFGPMYDSNPSERARLAARRLAYTVWITPAARLVGWLQRRIDRSRWGQP